MNRRNAVSGLLASLVAGLFAMAAPSAVQAAEINLTYAFFAPAKTFPAQGHV